MQVAHRLRLALFSILSRLLAILQGTVVLARNVIFPKAHRYVREGRWQILISCLIGIIGVALSYTEGRQNGASLLTFSSYFAFLVGIAAVTILVNSMTVGFLLYTFQAANDGRNYYYDKFRDATAAFRECLDSLCDEGLVGSDYDEMFRDIERLDREKLPVGWKEIFVPFLEELFDELRANAEPRRDSNRILGNAEVKALVLNEAVSGLWVNLMRRVLMRVWVSPVIKSFWTLALTISAIIIGAIYFAGPGAHILAGLAIGIGCMTILLILEIGFIAVTESKEFFDDETDIDHSSTEVNAQTSQEDASSTEA